MVLVTESALVTDSALVTELALVTDSALVPELAQQQGSFSLVDESVEMLGRESVREKKIRREIHEFSSGFEFERGVTGVTRD